MEAGLCRICLLLPRDTPWAHGELTEIQLRNLAATHVLSIYYQGRYRRAPHQRQQLHPQYTGFPRGGLVFGTYESQYAIGYSEHQAHIFPSDPHHESGYPGILQCGCEYRCR